MLSKVLRHFRVIIGILDYIPSLSYLPHLFALKTCQLPHSIQRLKEQSMMLSYNSSLHLLFRLRINVSNCETLHHLNLQKQRVDKAHHHLLIPDCAGLLPTLHLGFRLRLPEVSFDHASRCTFGGLGDDKNSNHGLFRQIWAFSCSCGLPYTA
ncbi:hypothetical protein Hanom_Chr16g01501021 [Helianthus anomalus]